MAKYLVDSSDIEIEEVSGTQNLKFNFKSGNTLETKINNLSNYSTTETLIGTWIDGKALYRKVYNFGTLPDTTSATINSDLNNVKIVKIYGYAVASNNTTIPLPYPTPSTNFIVSLNYTSDNKINIETGSDRTGYNGFVILEYTKG